jgi:hypothetical protein
MAGTGSRRGVDGDGRAVPRSRSCTQMPDRLLFAPWGPRAHLCEGFQPGQRFQQEVLCGVAHDGQDYNGDHAKPQAALVESVGHTQEPTPLRAHRRRWSHTHVRAHTRIQTHTHGNSGVVPIRAHTWGAHAAAEVRGALSRLTTNPMSAPPQRAPLLNTRYAPKSDGADHTSTMLAQWPN